MPVLPFSLKERSGVPEDQSKASPNRFVAIADGDTVQWWNSFIFAVFGAAILIGSREYKVVHAVGNPIMANIRQQSAAGLQTTLPIDPYHSILAFWSLALQRYSSVLLKQAGFCSSVGSYKESQRP